MLLSERNCTGCIEEYTQWIGGCYACPDVANCSMFLPEGCDHCGYELYDHCNGLDCDVCIPEFVKEEGCYFCSSPDECSMNLPIGCNHCRNMAYEFCNATGKNKMITWHFKVEGPKVETIVNTPNLTCCFSLF